MKVFLGWSGETSHKVAAALHGWLPKVIQSVKPYISSEDVAKGARWASEIAKELQASNYGIICITRDNLTSTWIHFEAGALSREIEKARVTPFLFNLKQSDIQGPFQQFQSVVNEKDDVAKMLKSINDVQDLDQRLDVNTLKEAFKMWWPELDEAFARIARDEADTPVPQRRPERDILEELLTLTQAALRGEETTREIVIDHLTEVRKEIDAVLKRTTMLGFQLPPSLVNLSALSGSDSSQWYGDLLAARLAPADRLAGPQEVVRLVPPQEKEQEKSGDSQIKTSPAAKGRTK